MLGCIPGEPAQLPLQLVEQHAGFLVGILFKETEKPAFAEFLLKVVQGLVDPVRIEHEQIIREQVQGALGNVGLEKLPAVQTEGDSG